jgi:acetyl esterase/lipase
LRDEALIYEHVLREQGVPTKLDMYVGLPHCTQDFFPMHSSSAKAVTDLKVAVQWILQK